MSSHHFVKEDQEPALILADVTGVSYPLVQELLEWSPTVIVFETALQNVLLWGIKIDVVVAIDGNIGALTEELKDQAPLKIISHQPEEDALTTAFYFLRAGKYKAVNVIGIRPALMKADISQFDLVVFSQGKRWSLIRHGKFEKWLTKGTVLNLLAEKKNNHFVSKGLNKEMLS